MTAQTTEFATKPHTFLENWKARHLARYAEEVVNGGHDQDCEQRERSSLCHCSKRRRERHSKTALPELWFHAPTCGGCHEDVEFDGDGFDCPRCSVSWDRHATDGDQADRFTDDHGPGPFGGEQFGERLLTVVQRDNTPDSRGEAVAP